MDTKRLEQFVAVAQEGGFGRAARRLGISQPALTRGIALLEAELGTRLFERGPRGALVSVAGDKLLPHALSILNEASRAIAELDSSHLAAEGQVRIGVSPNFLDHAIPRAVALLAARAPQLNVQVSTGTREILAAGLMARELDAALCLIPDFLRAGQRETAELSFEPLATIILEPYVRPGHPLLGRRVTVQEVADQRWAIPFELSLSYRFASLFFRLGLTAPQQAFNSAHLPLVRQVAMQGDLVAMLPRSEAQPDVAAGRLAPLDLPDMRFDYLAGLMLRRAVAVPTPLLRIVTEALRGAVLDSA
ncbi:LysR family transcriptional regulator [Sphingobium aromaticiconvertens]|uniref:LysR family transcriptional regulator n=1 Tax=Sphingobium aromaticiconvertens TaxID=365341 RepID=UPI00301B4A75